MFRKSTILFAITIASCSVFEEFPSPKVTLSHGGVLVGSYMNSVNGKIIQGFRGIPYAEPPVGKLRFQAGVPFQTWSGEKLANKDAEMCIQQNPYYRNFTTVGSEDCLYLNVYTPKDRTQQEPLSVMVFFHGGGWLSGGSISQLYGPDRILDNENIILVTGNYRLGPLGFLSTGTNYCPGNNGLKDQVLILKWVRDNIEAFGGNRNDVTIFGQSAGGGSVGYHLISPMSKGLFNKAIFQSGTNFERWALGETSIMTSRSAKLGRLLSCEGTEKELVECLRTKPAEKIISTIKDFFQFDIDPLISFQPVVERDIPGSFITKRPQDVPSSQSSHIDIMIGITAEEGVFESGPLLNLFNEEFKAKFNEAVPVLLFYQYKPADIRKKITAKIDEFYFNEDHDCTKEKHQNLTNLFTDGWFAQGMDQLLRKRLNANSDSEKAGQTFVYVYDHKGPTTQSVAFHAGPEYYGVCHTDELPYLFPYAEDVTVKSSDKNDEKMKWALPYMWVNFAKTGNPTPPGSQIDEWKPATKFPLNYAHIGSKNNQDWVVLKNEVGLLEDRLKFWRELEEDLRIPST